MPCMTEMVALWCKNGMHTEKKGFHPTCKHTVFKREYQMRCARGARAVRILGMFQERYII